MDLFTGVAAQYRSFAVEARESECFERWALGVAGDEEVLAWITNLPQIKQQPNLVFAAARWHGVPAPGPYAGLRAALLKDRGAIYQTIMDRSTQTNEVGRLATLTPVFAQIAADAGEPLALVEAGASAGLCLYPDRYDYDWTPEHRLIGSRGPTLSCAVSGQPKLPSALPTITWRSGIDLNPLDAYDAEAMAWLTNLVWPEQEDRRLRLEAAIKITRSDPPRLAAGNILTDLREHIDIAAQHGKVVIFHSAVIAYLTPQERAQFQSMMMELVAEGVCRWISNEGKNVLPAITATGPTVPADHPTFVLALDGQALAWTHGHGSSMTWL